MLMAVINLKGLSCGVNAHWCECSPFSLGTTSVGTGSKDKQLDVLTRMHLGDTLIAVCTDVA